MNYKFTDNALIESVSVGFYDDCVSEKSQLVVSLGLSGEGWGCCIGSSIVVGDYAGKIIRNILWTLDCPRWERLKGMYCRVPKACAGDTLKVIGHITKDRWFDFSNKELYK